MVIQTAFNKTGAGKGKGKGKGGSTSWGAQSMMQTFMELMMGGTGGSWGGSKTFKVDSTGGELGEHIGTIKSFGWKNNYGFITCPELAEYGDVFLHGDEKKGYQQGQKVKFDAVLNKDGKPVAIKLRSGLKAGEKAPAATGAGAASQGYKGSGGFKVDSSGGELGEHTGTIKSFGWNTNYGFITCPELAEYGDVFLHGDEKKGYQQGQKVKFDAVLNKDGKPVAIKLRSGLK